MGTCGHGDSVGGHGLGVVCVTSVPDSQPPVHTLVTHVSLEARDPFETDESQVYRGTHCSRWTCPWNPCRRTPRRQDRCHLLSDRSNRRWSRLPRTSGSLGTSPWRTPRRTPSIKTRGSSTGRRRTGSVSRSFIDEDLRSHPYLWRCNLPRSPGPFRSLCLQRSSLLLSDLGSL